MRWQTWVRGGVVLAGLACAIAVYLLFGSRRAAEAPPPPAVNPTTTSQMGAGRIERSKDGRPSMHIEFAGRTTFSDNRVRFERAHIQSFDERGLDMTADLAETEGKSVQADNPALLQLVGHVRLATKDGLVALMDRATYNDVTGVFETPAELTFTRGRMSGEGFGARYEEKRDLLSLLDRAHVLMAPDDGGGGALDARSREISVNRPGKVVTLAGDAHIVRSTDTLSSEVAVVHTTEDESRLTRMELLTRARVVPGDDKDAAAPPRMTADNIVLDFHEDGQTIRHAEMTGRSADALVDMTGTDGAHRMITGSHILFDLAHDGQTLTALDAARPVAVTLPRTAEAQARTIHADTLHAVGKEPTGLTNAQFDGRPDQPVQFVENVPKAGSPDTTRTLTSQRLVLLLDGQIDAIDQARFTGTVELSDVNGTAHADIADYDARDKTHRIMTLHPSDAARPSPRAENADHRLVDARTIVLFLDSATNDLDADGSVVTRANSSPPSPGRPASPLFSGDTPIQGRAASLQYRGNEATYTGTADRPAQVSQDRSVVKGEKVVFNSDTNDLRASRHVESVMIADSKDATTPPAAPTEYHVTNADSLLYRDADRRALFTGNPAKLTSPDGLTSARSVEMTFESETRAIRRMVWDGDVSADLTGRRRGVGARLTYTALDDIYVLTGTPAQALIPRTDGPQCSLSEGDTLTFNRTSGAAEGGKETVDKIDCGLALPYKKKEGMATLRTEGLTKSYGGRTVVRDINLDVSSGEIVGLLGPNGAGKTTTFSMVVGLTGADSGQVLLDDLKVTNDPMYVRARKGIGYLPQEASIFRGLTVEQNVLAILETQPIAAKERRTRLAELLGELNLAPLAHAKAHTLSGGERRRVEITRALVSNPKFMLLDEPFAGIDPIAVGDIQKIIFHLRDRGIGVLITDHNVRETLKITDRAYIVHGGAIFRSGTPASLAADEEVKRIYLGADFRLD